MVQHALVEWLPSTCRASLVVLFIQQHPRHNWAKCEENIINGHHFRRTCIIAYHSTYIVLDYMISCYAMSCKWPDWNVVLWYRPTSSCQIAFKYQITIVLYACIMPSYHYTEMHHGKVQVLELNHQSSDHSCDQNPRQYIVELVLALYKWKIMPSKKLFRGRKN